jgi:hypothetical protein
VKPRWRKRRWRRQRSRDQRTHGPPRNGHGVDLDLRGGGQLIGVRWMQLPIKPLVSSHRLEPRGTRIIGTPGHAIKEQKIIRLSRVRGARGRDDRHGQSGDGNPTHPACYWCHPLFANGPAKLRRANGFYL